MTEVETQYLSGKGDEEEERRNQEEPQHPCSSVGRYA